jgi:alkylation response protein AidB-like acyl-CoA dehydrogenase
MGRDCVSAAVVLEALGYGCRDHGLLHAICTQIVGSVQINLFGTAAQKKEYLPAIVRGEIVLCLGMTEADAGSDTSAIRTRAVPHGNIFTLNGRKVFISNGPVADLAIIFAVTDPSAKSVGRISCFLLSTTIRGFTRGPAMRKMGLNSLQNGELVLDDCEIEKTALFGKEGTGSAIFAEAMEWERILLFATQVGKLHHLLDRTVAQARSRQQFGQPIGRFQAIAHRVADIRVNLELGRLICLKAAWIKDKGSRATLESSIAKLFISESCKNACIEAVQIHGAYGYMKELNLERELRDSIASTIYSGTSEIQRNLIAALSGL